jgi:hypothetical protein
MTLFIALRRELCRVADPAKAPLMRAYMKSSMPYLGVSAPLLRAVCPEPQAVVRWGQGRSLERPQPAGSPPEYRA